MFVRSELRGLRMRFVAIKDIGNGLTVIGSKRSNIDQRFYALLIRSCNHCTGIGVSRDNHGTFCPSNSSVQRHDVFAERSEWERRSNDMQSLFAERENDFLPTRSIRPSTMGDNHCAVFRKSHVSIQPDWVGRLLENAAGIGAFAAYRSTKDPRRRESAPTDRRCRAD